MSELRGLHCDVLPHLPAAAELGLPDGCLVGGAVAGALCHGAVGDKAQIVVREVDGDVISLFVMGDDLSCCLLRIGDLELDIRHRDAVAEVGTVLLQVVDHRGHEIRELVPSAELQGGEIGKAADVVDEAVHVELHLESGVPVLKGKHCAPQAPEVRVQDIIGEDVLDGLVLEGFIGHHHEVRELQRCLLA